MKKRQLINSGTAFTATLMVAGMLSLIVYLTGLKHHRSLYLNSLLSTTIISFVFMAFITIGLYCGWKLKDTVGKLTERFSWQKWKLRFKTPDVTKIDKRRSGGWDWLEALVHLPGESVEGFLGALLLWVIAAVIGVFLLWWLGAIVWGGLLVLAAILYWVVFRVYRLIFFYSPRCKGKLGQSLGIAIFFTVLYNCWIYVIIFGAHYLAN